MAKQSLAMQKRPSYARGVTENMREAQATINDKCKHGPEEQASAETLGHGETPVVAGRGLRT